MNSCLYLTSGLWSFRPLPGDLISQLGVSVATVKRWLKFPSPSRGSYFSIRCFGCHSKKVAKVSVPFPGILFLNCEGMVVHTSDCRFPSPSRGSYFSIYSKQWKTILMIGFRPLPGDLISQYIIKAYGKDIASGVSVPFPGILFLNS